MAARAALTVWIAQGLGIGRLRPGPGTWGSGAGLAWLSLLLLLPGWEWFLGAVLLSMVLAVAVCGRAERCLNEKDPGSVVLDEIVALPLAYSGWIGVLAWEHGRLPQAGDLFSEQAWPLAAAIFLCFRLLDIVKPWPIRQSQLLSGGWGVVMDDVLAGAGVGLATVGIHMVRVALAP